MSESGRIQVIRKNQSIEDFIYERKSTSSRNFDQSNLSDNIDYYHEGLKKISLIQSLPIHETWPIILGNVCGGLSSGILGGLIAHRMARNLLLHLTTSTFQTVGATFLTVSMAHLLSYYPLVLSPMLSGDPMLCSTCLEIRSFALASFLPITLGTGIAAAANLSSCLLNKTIRLPQFQLREYREWKLFLTKHAFKSMSRRHFLAYPIINGFLASMIYLGQDHYWRNDLRQRANLFENHYNLQSESQKRSKLFGPVQDFFTKLDQSKVK